MEYWDNWGVAIVVFVGAIVGSMIEKKKEFWVLFPVLLITILSIEGFSRSGFVSSVLFIFMAGYILYLKRNNKNRK